MDLARLRRLGPLAALVVVTSGCAGQPVVTYASAPAGAASLSWSFDGELVGTAPSGSEVYSGAWAVRSEADAPSQPNALCQTGQAEFPAIALGASVYGDAAITVRFKPISGREDQAAGIIARVQDKGNYYVLRANALEGNVNLYKYASGRRSVIKEGSATVAAGRWQELRFELAGDRLRGLLDGRLVVEATDSSYRAGRIGLWTKADSVTCFDDLVVTPGSS